jgi:Mg-chelatase subunit ChlD
VLAELGVDSATLEAALQAVEAQPGSRIDMGLGQAGNLLRRSARTDARAMVVLLSDGRPAGASADDVRRAAAGLRDDSVTVYAVALGPGADSDLLGDVAGQRDRLVDAGDAEELDDVYAGIAGKLRCR